MKRDDRHYLTPDEYAKARTREKVRIRVARYRERKKASQEAQKICNIICNTEVDQK